MSDQPNNDPIEDDDLIEDVPLLDEEIETSESSTSIEDEASDISPIPTDEMDIDAALAAVSQLSLLSDEPADDEITDAEYHAVDDDTGNEQSVVEYVDDFEQPRDITMARGQLSSVLPALVLIILGGWLTFTLTTSNTAPSTGLLLAVVLIGIGAVFLSQWLTSSRWSRGNFFFGLTTFLIGGIQLYLSQLAPNMLIHGWTFGIIAVGVALLGTSYVTLPRLPRLSIMGILTILTGAIAYVITSGAIDATVLEFISNFWVVSVVIIAVMLLTPLLRRR